MKKAFSILIYLLFFLTILFPVGALLCGCFGYNFVLFNTSVFSVLISIIAVITVSMDLIFKPSFENILILTFLSLITPLALVNAAFLILESPHFPVLASSFISLACCCLLTLKPRKTLALKIISLVLSALMALPVIFLSCFSLIFGNLSQNTVVKTVESPSEKYYAQVIDSDQGALGGNTFVDVYEKCKFDLYFFKVEKTPQRIYSGDWGEFENMQIFWEEDVCLIINSVSYKIE